MMKRLVLVVCIALRALGSPQHLYADTSSETGASTYVSEKFKIVARRLIEQIAVTKLRDACGDERPICTLVVERLAAAFVAAVEKDQAGVKAALVGFFTDSAIHGALELAIGDLFDEPRAKEIRGVVGPLAICVGSYLTQKRPPAACILKDARKLLAAQLGIDFTKPCGDQDCMRAGKLVADIEAGRIPGASTVIYMLEAFASRIGRDDIRVYLDELNRFLADVPGIEGGMFDAAVHYFDDETQFVTKAIRTYDPQAYAGGVIAEHGVSLMYPGDDAHWAALRQQCSALDQTFAAWQKARDDGKFFVTARLALAARNRIDVAVLDALVNVRCTVDTRELQRAVSYLVAPLHVHNLYTRDVPILAAAALIDYIRFEDGDRLDRDVRELVKIALVRSTLPAQVQVVRDKLQPGEDLVKSLGSNCEILDLQHLLTFIPTDIASRPCTSLVKDEPQRPAPTKTKEVKAVTGKPSADVERARAADLEEVLERIESVAKIHVPELAGALDDVPVSELSKALVYIADGNHDAARKVVLRYGVTLLVTEVDRLSERLLQKKATDCETAAQSTSIFSGIGAACAAHILIQSAYYPIADSLWDSGLSASNVSTITAQTYQSLLENKALDRTPIILNIGLGANSIHGNADVWGNGVTALTVVDKFGVAFYKHSEPRWTFETGPFVGGLLDALVRTATGDGKDHRNWIAGYTVGFPRVAGMSIGVEAHVGAAIPFEIKAHDIGMVIGMTLDVPFSTLFQHGD